MSRLARNRDTHLTPGEIAAEVLREFDAGTTSPSIRQLARALDVAPSAIYHHFPSRAAIYEAGVDLVWQEATADLLELLEDPFNADPRDVLVTAGIATRRAFLRHYRIAPYASATPAASEPLANALALIANLMERMGLEGEEAAACFHTYASLTLGAVIFAAMRKIANDELEIEGRETFRATAGAAEASRSSERTRGAFDDVMEIAANDPDQDEQLFADGLRRLVGSFVPSG